MTDDIEARTDARMRAERDRAAVTVARDWIAACAAEGCWPDLTPTQARRLPAPAVIRGIEQHWGGGVAGYLESCAPEIADQRAEYARLAAARRAKALQARSLDARTR